MTADWRCSWFWPHRAICAVCGTDFCCGHTLAVFICVCFLLLGAPGGISPAQDWPQRRPCLPREAPLRQTQALQNLALVTLLHYPHIASWALASGISVDCPHHQTISPLPFCTCCLLCGVPLLSILGLSSNGPFLQEALLDLQAGIDVPARILYPRPVHSGSSLSGDSWAPRLDCDPKEGSTRLFRSLLCPQRRVGFGGVFLS